MFDGRPFGRLNHDVLRRLAGAGRLGLGTVLSSGHLASFERSKCKGPLNELTAATGQHCPEGWTLYTLPFWRWWTASS
jgi:hypothetical protein